MKSRAIIIVFSMFLLVGCSKSITPSNRYAKEHRDKSFEASMSRNESFTLPSVKDDLKEARKNSKNPKKKSRKEKKIEAVLAKIEKIKKNN
jgi:hypothetical protein